MHPTHPTPLHTHTCTLVAEIFTKHTQTFKKICIQLFCKSQNEYYACVSLLLRLMLLFTLDPVQLLMEGRCQLNSQGPQQHSVIEFKKCLKKKQNNLFDQGMICIALISSLVIKVYLPHFILHTSMIIDHIPMAIDIQKVPLL